MRYTIKPACITALIILSVCSCSTEIKKESVCIDVFSPSPEAQIKSVQLTEKQKDISESLCKFSFAAAGEQYVSAATDKVHSEVYSPISLQHVLALLANGVSGNASNEIISALSSGSSQSQINDYFKLLSESIPAVDLKSTYKLSDIVLFDECYNPSQAFKKTAAEFFYTPVVSMSFSDRDYVKRTINNWCCENTGGMIPKLLDDVGVQTMGYVVNSLYFRSLWDEPYDEKYTAEGLFYANGNTYTRKFLSSASSIRYMSDDVVTVACKTLGNGKFGMYLISPNGPDMKSCLDYLSENWRGIKSTMKLSPIRLKFPKFEIENSIEFITVLESLGIKAVFNNADFSSMISDGDRIEITRLFQKNRFVVDEKGVEGGSGTAVQIGATSSGQEIQWIEMNLDHPFIYVVEEISSGTILFIGVMAGD